LSLCFVFNFRWLWYLPLFAQLFHPPDDVHILRSVCNGASLQPLPVVEEIHDLHADCKWLWSLLKTLSMPSFILNLHRIIIMSMFGFLCLVYALILVQLNDFLQRTYIKICDFFFNLFTTSWFI
jgi:hypothetical protein